MTVSNSKATNQASEDETRKGIIGELSRVQLNAKDYLDTVTDTDEADIEKAADAIQSLIRTEKLKLLDEVIHQSTVNLKSSKAVAGWAEIRKKQLEAEL